MSAEQTRKLIVLAAIWAALLLAPYWMVPLGGYTALATRVLVLGLAAMSVNFLLGFTGVLSFGHAAYFGLGAYGAGLTLKFLAPSTPLALVAGMLLGGVCGGILGTLIVRRRGVYFAMVTIAFGQVFYYIAFQWSSLTGGDDGLRGFSRQPIDFGLFKLDILSNANNFYYFVLFCFALAVGAMGFILRSPFGRTMIAIRENERRSRFLGIPGGAAHLDRVHAVLLLHGVCRRALCAGQQLRRPARAALQPVRRFRHDGRDGRHAQLLGSAARRRRVRGAAGLPVERHRELDVVCRPAVCAGGAVLPARVARLPPTEQGMNVLEINNVTKRFGNLVAVRDVSLNVAKGEMCAIIGPNGAGKTTFFNLISGFFPPTSGTHHLRRQRHHPACDHMSASPAAWRGPSRSPRSFPNSRCLKMSASPRKSPADYRLRPWINRAEAAQVHQHVEETLKLVSLEAKADRLVGELAHGDQRAAEIAMALALKPHLLLLDEPTAGMGDQETYQITQLIRRLHRDSNYTIVLIEHDMRVVFHLADRICVLDQGRMLAQGTPQEIAANETVQAAYLGNAA